MAVTTRTAAHERVQVHPGDVPSASLRAADGRWVRIHSGRDPVAEAERFVDDALGALPGGAPAAVILIGPGLGYSVEALERRAPATRVIAIEPFEGLARLLTDRRHGRTRADADRFLLLTGPHYAGTAEAGRMLDSIAAATVVLEHPVMAREFPLEMREARGIAQRILVGARLNASAREAFAGRYLLNTLRNLPTIVEEGDVAALRQAFTAVPAVVVAAGPSLDRALPHLRQLQDRVLLIAVDTALRPLQAAGVRPAIAVAVDPSELNARHLLGLRDTAGTWLVSEGSLDPRVLPHFGGRIFTCKVSDHQPWPWLREHGCDRGTLRAWGSVLTTAFDLACLAGCDPIAFVGADLAYTGGAHYCRGTMNEDPMGRYASATERARNFAAAVSGARRPVCDQADIHGAVVTSTPQFVQFRDWIVARAGEAPGRVVNATGAGILHGASITQLPLHELPFSSAPLHTAERLDAAWRAARERNTIARAHLRPVLETPDPALPVTVWREFTAGTTTAEQINAALVEGWTGIPRVTEAPASVGRVAGALARFSARAAGAGGLQWQESHDGGVNWTDVVSATSQTFERRVARGDDGLLVRAVFRNAAGVAASDAARVDLVTPAAPSDFDGDGRPDLLWRHAPTGESVIWRMQGSHFTAVERLADIQPDLAWRVAAVADLDGDGHTDIVWAHAGTGAMVVWLMQGPVRLQEVPLDDEPDTTWQVVGTADFDGDGRPDLLWRNVVSGELRVWLMDGTARRNVLGAGIEHDHAWRVVALADFDGDGRPDLVWRHARSGANRVWLLDGLRCRDVIHLESEPDPRWHIVAALDMTGDGAPDLIWRQVETGENRIWFMRGFERVAVGSFEPAACARITPDWLLSPETGQLDSRST